MPKSVRENVTLAVARRFSRHGILDLGQERALVDDDRDPPAEHRARRAQSSRSRASPGGNQQKVVIALEALLLTQARVLLLYDLTRGVDVGTKGEIFRLMRQLADDGYAILFFSTDMQELLHVADRVAVLADGTVSGLLAGNELTEDAILRAAIAHGTAA